MPLCVVMIMRFKYTVSIYPHASSNRIVNMRNHEMSNATRCAEHVRSKCYDSLRFVRKEKNAITRFASPRISSASECFASEVLGSAASEVLGSAASEAFWHRQF